ncbi:DUF3757 domain-containing protein [Fluoribacter dumoffii]|uniref:Protein of uncharacterized function (DUF3757) n=1 Tax=Fluoribacter dumoffii TaxID=463 RepID=A0A377GBJ5_9GAMM|nr:DUF3757 domain-containing protein [Fluoribacter dumoffii]KTC88622.1 hypothetical protein Ldum_2880 [Fluoribacter dumoffii NY 23]MCW8386086.1 DUF3757 domain-containing protein [Fluoribacter dumoffii]MCW8419138.1 DUF3757 domain-containing protein [Fluoribacter dumoffii]MCW8453018.1 DUF3757 domain-containing protein [Fluoribacter dumoffii]MCW8459764.1 DUF3757 domain-containing protein [Fluoribacter dumoffii]
MRTHRWIIFSAIYAQFTVTAYATNCPDPQTTSLKWGVPPAPWTVNPYSPNRPQGDKNTLFVRANILVAGYGQGVVCTYRNSGGEYSIWWQVPTKIPSRLDYNWIETLNGFVCSQGLEQCQFHTA